jgi:N-methylhydantoinase A
MNIGVDIGGTFTDFVMNDNGVLKVHKRLSTPHNPAESMLAGLQFLATDLERITQVAHGSTVATNAILERKGAKIALISTQGFRDVLFIGRQNRPQLYALHPKISTPLVTRDDCYEIPERIDHHGNVLLELDKTALAQLVKTIAKKKYDAMAVCLLYSFINPEHELEIRSSLVRQGFQMWQVALSHEVLPEFREYERASTTALEAYVRPIMDNYITQLRQKLPAKTSLRIMKSDGGVMSAETIREKAVMTALSGPAAGVLGASYLAKLAGFSHIITLDIGGTSTDVALCADELPLANNGTIDNLPLRARLLDIETVGAGGGSLARVDDGGALRVGPQSAGAMPGPVCYGRGGQQSTVTDANLVLGRISATHFLGGEMALDIQKAQQSFSSLAQKLNLSIEQVAKGMLDVANVNIDRALRRVSIARGHDPRKFTLVAFGGAGGLHACEVAEALEIPQVMIPQSPGVLCALGLLVADVRVDYSRPILATANRTVVAKVRALQAELIAKGRDSLLVEQVDEATMNFIVSVDMRYRGQAYELNIPLKGDIVEEFHIAHHLQYGHDLRERVVEIVNLRVSAIGTTDKPDFQRHTLGNTQAQSALIQQQPIPIYAREKLQAGMQWQGESLVVQLDATTYIPKGWQAQVDAYLNILLKKMP